MLKTNENIIEKLKYLKLDLNKIPDVFKEHLPLKFRANRVYDDTYKIYRYIDIKDIEILLVDSHKDEDLNKKYSQAIPLISYINAQPDNEDDIVRHTIFLKMLRELNIEDVENIEEIQQSLNKKVPFEVKYDKNYLWEIYYSESTNKYFMLIPTKETVNPTLFYLIKKKIQNKKNDKIFVPITNLQYVGQILKKSEIEDLEKYVWLFTKQWAWVYEVEDYKGEVTLQIVGNVNVYENIQTIFKIILKEKEEAKKFYNLLKALFILQTELPNHYNFEVLVDKKGGLEFLYNSKKIQYKDLTVFLKEEYIKFENEINKTKNDIENSNRNLSEIKKEIEKYSKEYNLKEKQIATYLQCKRSFFGKFKYFFKLKKKKLDNIEENKSEDEEQIEQVIVQDIELNTEGKEIYTIEDLVIICNNLDKKTAEYKNLIADYKAQQLKLEIIKKKNENAKLYIEEIENHKKSIFEFWKFASKDEPAALDIGETIEETLNKMHKVFVYEDDIEEFGKSVDEYQRKNLNKKEFDDIFKIVNTNLELINNIENTKLLEEEIVSKLKKYKENELTYKKEDFDIFGSVLEDKTKIKLLGKNKHREIEKNIYKLLNINDNITASELKENLKETKENLDEIFNKLKAQIDMPIYYGIKDSDNFDFSGFKLCEINAGKAVENINSDKISLYRFNIKENMPIVYLTNSVFYDNSNKTLPLGMEIKEQGLIDLKLFELELKDKKQIRLNKEENGKYKINIICIYEYDLKLK